MLNIIIILDKDSIEKSTKIKDPYRNEDYDSKIELLMIKLTRNWSNVMIDNVLLYSKDGTTVVSTHSLSIYPVDLKKMKMVVSIFHSSSFTMLLDLNSYDIDNFDKDMATFLDKKENCDINNLSINVFSTSKLKNLLHQNKDKSENDDDENNISKMIEILHI